MAETVEGGVYKDATGDGYHDANGKPVDGGKVAEAQKLQREQSQQKTASFTPLVSQSSEALAEAVRSLITQPQPARQAPAPDTDADLAAETERRARKQG